MIYLETPVSRFFNWSKVLFLSWVTILKSRPDHTKLRWISFNKIIEIIEK